MRTLLQRLGRFAPGTSAARLAVIDSYAPSAGVRYSFRQARPTLTDAEVEQVVDGLRQWFRLHARAGSGSLAMPSQVVDDLWHAFMLHSREYAGFCSAALGRFLHHTPESGMTAAAAVRNESQGLARTLELAVKHEALPPGRLPLLFRIDEELGVEDGRRYLAPCGSATAACVAPVAATCLAHLHRSGDGGDAGAVHGAHGDGDGGAGGGCGGGCGGS